MLVTASACIDVETGHPPDEGSLSLAYNVHGLPPEITGDDTAGRMELIAPLPVDFDVAGLVEDFDDDKTRAVAAAAEHETQRRFAELYEERVYGSGSVLARATEVDTCTSTSRTARGSSMAHRTVSPARASRRSGLRSRRVRSSTSTTAILRPEAGKKTSWLVGLTSTS